MESLYVQVNDIVWVVISDLGLLVYTKIRS